VDDGGDGISLVRNHNIYTLSSCLPVNQADSLPPFTTRVSSIIVDALPGPSESARDS